MQKAEEKQDPSAKASRMTKAGARVKCASGTKKLIDLIKTPAGGHPERSEESLCFNYNCISYIIN